MECGHDICKGLLRTSVSATARRQKKNKSKVQKAHTEWRVHTSAKVNHRIWMHITVVKYIRIKSTIYNLVHKSHILCWNVLLQTCCILRFVCCYTICFMCLRVLCHSSIYCICCMCSFQLRNNNKNNNNNNNNHHHHYTCIQNLTVISLR